MEVITALGPLHSNLLHSVVSLALEKREHFRQLLRIWVDRRAFNFIIGLFVLHLFHFGASFAVISVKRVDRNPCVLLGTLSGSQYLPLDFSDTSPWRSFQICGSSLGLFVWTLGQVCLLSVSMRVSLPEWPAGFPDSACPNLNSSLFTWMCLHLLLEPDCPFKSYRRETWEWFWPLPFSLSNWFCLQSY